VLGRSFHIYGMVVIMMLGFGRRRHHPGHAGST